MEDSTTRLLEALSAHVEGLEAALGDVGSEAAGQAAGDSIRRIARSIRSQSETLGAQEMVELAGSLLEASAADTREKAEELMGYLETLRGSSSTAKAHLLLVEDNRVAAAAVRAYLEKAGYVVHSVGTATAAEERLKSGQPVDLVLLDLILPDRDGRDLLVQMREHASTAALPVVVLSAQSGPAAQAECRALGASEFIEKPVAPKALRLAVARQLAGAKNLANARRDPLTRLPNRAALLGAFERARDEAERVAVALVDLDGLKGVNDSLGHDAGDLLLATIAKEVQASLGPSHVLARWGGEEFAIVAPGADMDDLRDLLVGTIERLRWGSTDQGFEEAGLTMSFCAGVSQAQPEDDWKTCLAAADRALDQVKAEGRGRVATTRDLRDPSQGPAVKQVLLLEDDRVTAALIQHRLSREGFEVHHFDDGTEASRAAANGRFDLAILDVKVPGVDGFTLLASLRRLPHFKETPVLMLTSMGSEADVVRGLSLGANDYMLKPFSPTELVARARRLARWTG